MIKAGEHACEQIKKQKKRKEKKTSGGRTWKAWTLPSGPALLLARGGIPGDGSDECAGERTGRTRRSPARNMYLEGGAKMCAGSLAWITRAHHDGRQLHVFPPPPLPPPGQTPLVRANGGFASLHTYPTPPRSLQLPQCKPRCALPHLQCRPNVELMRALLGDTPQRNRAASHDGSSAQTPIKSIHSTPAMILTRLCNLDTVRNPRFLHGEVSFFLKSWLSLLLCGREMCM